MGAMGKLTREKEHGKEKGTERGEKEKGDSEREIDR
jgi:hypothetical protein